MRATKERKLLPKLTVFFGHRQQSNAHAGQKKTKSFFRTARPKSNASDLLSEQLYDRTNEM